MPGTDELKELASLTKAIWWEPADQPPDDDMTVLVAATDDDYPVWVGYHDGDGWKSAEGSTINPTHWAEFPEPPL